MDTFEKYKKIPEDILSQIDDYVRNGTRPGRFLMGLLSDEISSIMLRGSTDLELIEACVLFIAYETPVMCHGSDDAVLDWVENGGRGGKPYSSMYSEYKNVEKKALDLIGRHPEKYKNVKNFDEFIAHESRRSKCELFWACKNGWEGD